MAWPSQAKTRRLIEFRDRKKVLPGRELVYNDDRGEFDEHAGRESDPGPAEAAAGAEDRHSEEDEAGRTEDRYGEEAVVEGPAQIPRRIGGDLARKRSLDHGQRRRFIAEVENHVEQQPADKWKADQPEDSQPAVKTGIEGKHAEQDENVGEGHHRMCDHPAWTSLVDQGVAWRMQHQVSDGPDQAAEEQRDASDPIEGRWSYDRHLDQASPARLAEGTG